MSVNLDKNRLKIIAAWKDVVDDKTNTNWALYGYEGQTNDLKVIETSEGGLEELGDELNSGKIMYAFVRVNDPKTSLTKYLLINWQGEGAPTLRKGTCANHIRDIAKLLTGAHLTINARTDDDFDVERIMDKISAVGSAYSFKEPRLCQEESNRGPIGTNYSRVIPAKEINVKARDNFWKKEEEEERRRVELERERRQEELVKSEKERRAREEREHIERERRNLVNEIQSPTTVTEKSIPSPLSPVQLSPTRTMTQAEEWRQQRNNEAKQLIGTRVGAAKAIFNQNTASGQMQTSSANNKMAAPIKPVRNSIAQRINTLNNHNNQQEQQQQDYVGDAANDIKDDAVAHKIDMPQTTLLSAVPAIVEEEIIETTTTTTAKATTPTTPTTTSSSPIIETNVHIDAANEPIKLSSPEKTEQRESYDDGDQFSTIKRSPYTKTNGTNSQVATPVEPDAPNNFQTENVVVAAQANADVAEDDLIYQDYLKEGGLKAKALYDYQAVDESEISFDPGDIITHIDQIDEGWWQGLGPDRTYGLFPANYVELIN